MATEEQIAAQKAAGKEVERARATREDYGDRPAQEVKQLREQAVETAACCADCFTPLAPGQSVTLTTRAVEHVDARYNYIGQFIPAHDRHADVPICLTCWLTDITTPLWIHRGVRARAHADDHADPLGSLWEVRRLRCEGCGRPLRVESKRGRRLLLRERCCCAACLRMVTRRRNNERRRVRHQPIRCAVCRQKFTPTQSTAKTCSNKCRQALHRRRHKVKRRIAKQFGHEAVSADTTSNGEG